MNVTAAASFYQCQFQQTLVTLQGEAIADSQAPVTNNRIETWFRLDPFHQHLFSRCLWERQDHSGLAAFRIQLPPLQESFAGVPAVMIAEAEARFVCGDLASAEKQCLAALRAGDDPCAGFQAYLILLEIYLRQHNWKRCQDVLAACAVGEDDLDDVSWLQLERLRLAVWCQDPDSHDRAIDARAINDQAIDDRYQALLQRAIYGHRPYFVLAGLIGWAEAAADGVNKDRLQWAIGLAEQLLVPEETRRFAAQLQKLSQSYPQTAGLVFRDSAFEVHLEREVFDLSGQPLLFGFLRILAEAKSYAAKRACAQQLWPAEDYLPKVHHPRLFDLARRSQRLLQHTRYQIHTFRSGFRLDFVGEA